MPDPDAMANALRDVAELIEDDCSDDPMERLLEIAKKHAAGTHPSDQPISGLNRWH